MSCCDAQTSVYLPIERWAAAFLQDVRCSSVAQSPIDLAALPSVSVASSVPPLSRVAQLHAIFARLECWLHEWALTQNSYSDPLRVALRLDGALHALVLARAPAADDDGHLFLVQAECSCAREPPQLVVHGRSGAARRLWSITSSPPSATTGDCALHMLVQLLHFHLFRRTAQCLCDALQHAIDEPTLLALLDAVSSADGVDAVRAQQLHASYGSAPFLQLVLNDVLPLAQTLTLYQFAEVLRERVHATALHTGAAELSVEQRDAVDRELEELRDTLDDSHNRLSPERRFALVLSAFAACSDPACVYARAQSYRALASAPGLQIL